jgi:hypothetical protein
VREIENPVWNPYKITCTDKATNQSPDTKNTVENIVYLNGGLTVAESNNSTGTTACASSLTKKINELIGDQL